MWKNLSHPNVLNLIGVLDTLEDGKFSVVSEWMTNGNILEYVGDNAGNHLKLVGHNHIFLRHLLSTFQLADAVEGLKYLHNANIVHGDLKGVSLRVRILRMPLIFSGQCPGRERQSCHGVPRGLRTHDYRAQSNPRDGVIKLHSRRRNNSFSGSRTPCSIKVRTG